MFGLGLPELLVIIVIGGLFVLPIICIGDIARNNFSKNNKIIWILVVIFLPLIGCIMYYFVGRNQIIYNQDNLLSHSQDLHQKNINKYDNMSVASKTTGNVKTTRKCPFCAEDIKVEAIKCKHCGSMLQ